ncbi:MAG: LysM peptidoglycan-binding domain-containing protein [Bacteroidetes bacterium]|nr:LysM peptidoglycan-binding domain-containing protein [Bacteroidota bacterium]
MKPRTFTSRLYVACLFLVMCLWSVNVSAQEKKSSEIKTINGKKYYIHKVEKGQSLYAISKLYGVDVNHILADNDEAIDGLKPGQELKIPVPGAVAVTTPATATGIDTSRYICHKVAKGETLYAIQKKYNKSEKQLMELNPGLTASIREGQLIAVAEKPHKNTRPVISTVKDTVRAADTLKLVKAKKNSYNIGLFLPFKLNETELINVDEYAKGHVPFPAIQSLAADFYLGFKKAVDSLSAKDYELNLKLFDTDDRDSSRMETICKSEDFKSLDMIIGPLYASSFKIVSQRAKALSIPIVSPLTQQSKILFGNPYVSKVTPSLFTLIEGIADYTADSLADGNNVMLVNTGSAKDLQYLKAFKKEYNHRMMARGKTVKDSVTEVKGLGGVKSGFVPGKKNVVVYLSNNQVLLADFITQLYVFSDKKDILLTGFNTVSEIDNLDQEYLNKLQFHFATQSCINYNDSTTLGIVKAYQSYMNTDPSEYYFDGFDIGMYYLKNLKEQGPALFLQLDKYKYTGVSSTFNFYHPDASTGFENKAVFIYKYDQYRLLQTGWKNYE